MFPLCEDSISNSNIMETFNHDLNILRATSDLSTVGSRIRYYRLLNNLTQDELATRSALDRSTIIRYENDLVEHSIDIVDRISETLKIIPSIIYDDYLKFISSDYDNKIKYIRMRLGLNQKELGEIIGVNQATISNWERSLSMPSRESFTILKELINESCTAK